MKITIDQVTAICSAVAQVMQEGRFADQAIERQLKTYPFWSVEEQGFVAEQVYGLVRYHRMLCAVLGRTPTTPLEWEEILGTWLLLQNHPGGAQFRSLSKLKTQQSYERLKEQRAVLESIPDWLDELGFQELGEKWPPTLHALNQPPQLTLRVNQLKTQLPVLQKHLQQYGILGTPLSPNALLIEQRGKIFSTAAFREGWFEVQDFASQQVAPFLEVEPGMRVIDACAGNGGKALHLADLMKNKGQIIALDTDAKKLEQLRLRARRAGVSIIETRLIESTKTIKRLAQSADRLLLDVPCSGLGVLRRNPDTRWRLTLEHLKTMRTLQQNILHSYTRMCRPGGKLVYATCSILPSENQVQVDAFMQQPALKFLLEESKDLLPQDFGFDGFYMARLAAIG